MCSDRGLVAGNYVWHTLTEVRLQGTKSDIESKARTVGRQKRRSFWQFPSRSNIHYEIWFIPSRTTTKLPMLMHNNVVRMNLIVALVPMAPQLKTLERELMESVEELTTRRWIIGTPLTVDEILDPQEEKNIGEVTAYEDDDTIAARNLVCVAKLIPLCEKLEMACIAQAGAARGIAECKAGYIRQILESQVVTPDDDVLAEYFCYIDTPNIG
ncbi:uncharacterized protein EDB91DRAFT_1076432 [Suillus paluster]|uniref:uncharacterized protein n=1 Tax=Suillus paluster TaxID=48578 RepID=UPI001B87414F|nr:uncharacterized protein EDB91DRAFT_1076432 [Suillus paluster]KAG1756386.1 hypothetical protein EDB91DRAFT_1076432 [Suillus paluster]